MRERLFPPIYNSDITEREINNSIISRKAAEEGFVLLKNNGVLPLKEKKNIALYGAGAQRTVKGGWGSGDVNERKNICIKEGLEKDGYVITTQNWIDDYECIYEQALKEWQKECEEFWEFNNDKYIIDAIPFIMPAGRIISDEDIKTSNTDTAIYVLSRTSGEGADRKNIKGDYKLFDIEISNLKILVEKYSNVILIINSGGMIDLSFLDEVDNIGAIIYMSQAGIAGGKAISNIISGKVSPSGKLTDTWAKKYEDYPISRINQLNSEDEGKYIDGILVGYRYFDAFNIKPKFEFGYGLSYTDFSIEMSNILLESDNIKIKLKVKNIGKEYSGKEVIQIYISGPNDEKQKEYQRLVGFKKTKLLIPNEEQEINITVNVENMKSYDEYTACWVLDKGKYIIRVGNSSRNTKVAAYINVKQKIILEKVKNICKSNYKINEIKPIIKQRYENIVPTLTLQKNKIKTGTDIYCKEISKEARKIANKLSLEELCNIVCGAHKDNKEEIKFYESVIPGAAGETTSILRGKYGITNLIFADGPAGVKLKKEYLYDNKKAYQYCTAMPIGTLLAQTWNENILQEVGFCIGGEMDEFGISIWLAPGMNIHRDPLCGRNFEYFSEDPLLTGIIGANIIMGLQRNKGVGATVKHFACNNTEKNRVFYNSIISEKVLREIYLRGFEIAVKLAQPIAVMTSYNSINNIPTANSYDLCTQVLRKEWGFNGIVMTDWFEATIGGSIPSEAIKAGNDLIMPGHLIDVEEIKNSVKDGKLDIKDLRECATNIIDVILKSNKYEHK